MNLHLFSNFYRGRFIDQEMILIENSKSYEI